MIAIYCSTVCGVMLILTPLCALSSLLGALDFPDAILNCRVGASDYPHIVDFITQNFGQDWPIKAPSGINPTDFEEVARKDHRYNEVVTDVVTRLEDKMRYIDDSIVVALGKSYVVDPALHQKAVDAKNHFARCRGILMPKMPNSEFTNTVGSAARIVAVGADDDVVRDAIERCRKSAALYYEIKEFMIENFREHLRQGMIPPAIHPALVNLEDELNEISSLNRGYINDLRPKILSLVNRIIGYAGTVLERLHDMLEEPNEAMPWLLIKAAALETHFQHCYRGLLASLVFFGQGVAPMPIPVA